MKGRRIEKLLIANRGEIALRVMRTCRELGISTVAVYSDADRHSPHARHAVEAVHIGPSPSRESYLNIEKIIAAARITGADAIHPGYGFLAENAEFAASCDAAGIIFIGPSPESMRLMGLKSPARRLVAAAGVPVVPGYDGEDQSNSRLRAEALAIGLPVLIKASAGGGGKGMRIVRSEGELDGAIEAARREAEKSFGDGALLIEKYIEGARHVEVQILGDRHGNLIHLFERDCSLQRRHQKIIEESPSPAATPELRERLGAAAVAVGRAIDYESAGTVEFILAPSGDFYFIEVNTRLQVEHPVTEMITGLDLVRMQIEIAEGRKLEVGQETLTRNGHAIEARLYAEDPENDFLPSTGRVRGYERPEAGTGLRIESGIENGLEIGIHYDPLLAKIIAHGTDREDALRRLAHALERLSIHGLSTNRDFLINLLRHHEVREGRADTRFIEEHLDELISRPDETARAEAAAITAIWLQRSWRIGNDLLASLPPSYRNNPYRDPSIVVEVGGETIEVSWRSDGAERYQVSVKERVLDVLLCEWSEDGLRVEIDGVQRHYRLSREDGRFDWHSSRGVWSVRRRPRFPERMEGGGHESAHSPMPGQVLKILVAPGQTVSAGDPLLILEAMKMEQTIRAATAGVVEEIHVKTGDVVSPGERLLEISAMKAPPSSS